MSSLISQFSPYTCVLDCWAHFMRERGNQISTEELLKNHRDLCWNDPKWWEYGSLDKTKFEELVRRYKMICAPFTPKDADEVEARIKNNRGVFVMAADYNGNRHMLRIVGRSADQLEVLTPALPYGLREHVTVDHVTTTWKGEFLDVG